MTHLHPVERLRISGVIPLLSLCAFLHMQEQCTVQSYFCCQLWAQNKRITLNVSPILTAVTVDKYQVKSISI